MLGFYKFDLDPKTVTEQPARTEIEVYFDVSVEWDKNRAAIVYGNLEPLACSILIGGKTVLDDYQFADLAPSVQGYIKAKLDQLDMADIGCNDIDAMAEIVENDPIKSAVE